MSSGMSNHPNNGNGEVKYSKETRPVAYSVQNDVDSLPVHVRDKFRGLLNELDMSLRQGNMNPKQISRILGTIGKTYDSEALALGRVKNLNSDFATIERWILGALNIGQEDYQKFVTRHKLDRKGVIIDSLDKLMKTLDSVDGKPLESEVREANIAYAVTQAKALYALRVLKDRIEGANSLLRNNDFKGFKSMKYLPFLQSIDADEPLSYGIHPLLSAEKISVPKKESLRKFLDKRGLSSGDYRKLRNVIYSSSFKNALDRVRLSEKGFSTQDLDEETQQEIYTVYASVDKQDTVFYSNGRFSKREFARIMGLRSVGELNKIIKAHARSANDLRDWQKDYLSQEFAKGREGREEFMRTYGITADAFKDIQENYTKTFEQLDEQWKPFLAGKYDAKIGRRTFARRERLRGPEDTDKVRDYSLQMINESSNENGANGKNIETVVSAEDYQVSEVGNIESRALN